MSSRTVSINNCLKTPRKKLHCYFFAPNVWWSYVIVLKLQYCRKCPCLVSNRLVLLSWKQSTLEPGLVFLFWNCFYCTDILEPLMGKGQNYIFSNYIYNGNVSDIKEKCHSSSTIKIYLYLSPCPYIVIFVVVILIQIQL